MRQLLAYLGRFGADLHHNVRRPEGERDDLSDEWADVRPPTSWFDMVVTIKSPWTSPGPKAEGLDDRRRPGTGLESEKRPSCRRPSADGTYPKKFKVRHSGQDCESTVTSIKLAM